MRNNRANTRFVGAIVENEERRVLIERRTTSVPYYAGMFGVPGGTIEGGEESDRAVARELLEETGLVADSMFPLLRISRKSGSYQFYQVTPRSLSPAVQEPENAVEFAFLNAAELPEHTAFESLIAVTLWATRAGVPIGTLPQVVDRIFSSIFYSYIFPHLRHNWPDDPASEPLFHTILHTPWRKFKSALPFLLTSCRPEALPFAIASEVLFSTFYLMDDLIDGKLERYGHRTALGAHGAVSSAACLLTINSQTRHWIDSVCDTGELRAELSELVETSLDRLARAQVQRHRAELSLTIAEYEKASAERTGFLGEVWIHACRAAGHEIEGSLIKRIYSRCAVVGQIKNDLQDIAQHRFEDLADGIITAPSILLLERCSRSEAGWLLSTVWKRGRAPLRQHIPMLVQLFSRYQVREALVAKCQSEIVGIQDTIQNAAIRGPQRAILLGWVQLQLANSLGNDDGDKCIEAILSFLRSVLMLTRSAEPMNEHVLRWGR
jgi:8-oxo-dGTP pyrophosphatase MutT (NUDIX family)